MQVINGQSPVSQEAEVVEHTQNSLETMESGKLPLASTLLVLGFVLHDICIYIYGLLLSVLIMGSLYIINSVCKLLRTYNRMLYV